MADYLYVAGSTAGNIDAVAVDAVSPALTPLPGSPYKLPSTPCGPSGPDFGAYSNSMYDGGGDNIYAANRVGGVIDGYAVASAARTLTTLAGSPWVDTHCEGGSGIDYPQTWMSPRSLAVDGGGKFLYALSNSEDDIATYSIVSDGALKFLKFTPTQDNACYGAVRTDSAGGYLYTGSCITGPAHSRSLQRPGRIQDQPYDRRFDTIANLALHVSRDEQTPGAGHRL